MKLFFLTLVPALVGYMFRKSFGTYQSSLIFILMGMGALSIIPMAIELVIKSRRTKRTAANSIQVSNFSGYLLIFGLIFFAMGVGYCFAV